MPTPLITHEIACLADRNGYTIDIGQVSKDARRELDKKARRGEVIKCRGRWPGLTMGCSPLKTIYVNAA